MALAVSIGAMRSEPPSVGTKLRCPFCGAPETERFEMEGRRIIVFPCLFSPVVPLDLPEADLAAHLQETYGSEGRAYFQRQCDRLHYFVAAGRGQQILESETSSPAPPGAASGSP